MEATPGGGDRPASPAAATGVSDTRHRPGDTPGPRDTAPTRRPVRTLNLRRAPVSSLWRWFFTVIWLVYLVQPIGVLFGPGHSPAAAWGGVVMAATFCTVYVGVLGRWADPTDDRFIRRDRRAVRARLGLAILVALAVVACLVYGNAWTTLWLYVSTAVGFTWPGRRTAILAVLGASGCYALFSWITHAPLGEFLSVLLPVVLIGWAMVGLRFQFRYMRELRQAREVAAQLAAAEERLRLARDIHDLTGQSLSLITLKSDLAVRLLDTLPAAAPRDAVIREVAAIGQVSRQTLHDIREAVSGYRRPTLAVELITARTALEAAGIRLDDSPRLTLASGMLDPAVEGALAWCLREAVTNVIRHSGARTCRVTLTDHGGQVRLEISDDGRGVDRRLGLAGTAPPDRGPRRPDGDAVAVTTIGDTPAAGEPRRGSGLRGMNERVSAVGGSLQVEPAGCGGGFRVVATVPVAAPRTTETAAGAEAGRTHPPGHACGTARDRTVPTPGVPAATSATVPP